MNMLYLFYYVDANLSDLNDVKSKYLREATLLGIVSSSYQY